MRVKVNSRVAWRDCQGVSGAHLGVTVFAVVTGSQTLFVSMMCACLEISMRVDGQPATRFNQGGVLQGESKGKVQKGLVSY